MCNAHRCKHPVVLVRNPRYAGLRVYEIKFLVYGKLLVCAGCVVPFVVVSVDAVVNVSVLYVGVYVYASYRAIVGSHIYVGIVLCTVVTVIFVVGVQVAQVLLYPQNLPEMVAIVAVGSTADNGCNSVIAVCEGKNSTAKMVVHSLFAYEVALGNFRSVAKKRLQGIFPQLAVALVLLVVSVTFCVVQSKAQLQVFCKIVVNE